MKNDKLEVFSRKIRTFGYHLAIRYFKKEIENWIKENEFNIISQSLSTCYVSDEGSVLVTVFVHYRN